MDDQKERAAFEAWFADYNPAGKSDKQRAQDAYRAALAAAPAPHPDTADAERWRTFIGLPYAIRAEWANNLSLAPVLTAWVDSAIREQRNALPAIDAARAHGIGASTGSKP